MTNTRASKRRRGTILTIVGAFMLPAGLIIAGWRGESGAAITIGAAVIVVSIAVGVVGLLLHLGESQK